MTTNPIPPRTETAAYYTPRAPFSIPLPAALPSEDLHAIAARAMDQREIHGDEAHQLGEGFELIAGQLDEERQQHQVAVHDREMLRDELADATALIASALREQLRLQSMLTARDADIASLRRQLAEAREQVADAQIAAPVITQASYAEIRERWRREDAEEERELERRQRLHEHRAASMTLDDDAVVIEVGL